jgi:transcriptional regulator with XRE-family HTH domain
MNSSLSWFVRMSLSARLVSLRKAKGMSQQQMADAIGLHVTQIKRYESGATQPSLEALKKIAVALGVSSDSLLFEENERGPDEDLRLQFDVISRMPKKERQVIRELIDGMIIKYETQRWNTRSSATS